MLEMILDKQIFFVLMGLICYQNCRNLKQTA